MASVRSRHLKSTKGTRPNRVWDVQYRDPQHQARSKTFTTKAQADAFAVGIEADKDRGLWTDPRRGKVLISDGPRNGSHTRSIYEHRAG